MVIRRTKGSFMISVAKWWWLGVITMCIPFFSHQDLRADYELLWSDEFDHAVIDQRIGKPK